MATTTELDQAAEQAIQHYKNGELEEAESVFSALMMSACFAEGTEDEHIDRITRLLDARLSAEISREDIRGHVEQILNGMSEPADRLAGFSLILRNFT